MLPLAKNASRKLRTLRHPGVIKTLDVIENDTHIYVITERVVPLSWHVKRKSLSEETIKWGLHSIASTLKFINNDAASVHGSVRVASVYTSESGEWKLGGFEVLSTMNEDDALIYTYGSLVPDANRYAPPEIANGGWTAIKRNPLSAPDSYGLGTLVYEAFNGSFLGTDQLAQPRSVPASMTPNYKRLISNNPKLRLSAGHFVEQGMKQGGFFQTSLIHITQGVDNLGLKSEDEREAFLNELDGLTDDFPEDFFKMKILPELLKSVEFGGGGPKVFNAIAKIGAKLSEDEFEAKLAPVVIRLFASPDRAMRVCLLDNLPSMIDRLSQKDVNNKIFPLMVTGFTDTAPVVREQTVKAVLTTIVKLSDRTINGELLRYLAKTANDEQPGIRTNTTICLGKIAKYLGTGSRSKVLVAAFSRSLRDPFVHARNAALMAFAATSEYFTEEDCATKVLPALCISLVDKERMVRDQANKTIDAYLQRVRKYAASLPDTALPSEASNTTTAPAARIGNVSDTSWAGWAISSFTNKMTAANGEMSSSVANGTAAGETRSTPASGRATPIASITTERAGLTSQLPARSGIQSVASPPPEEAWDADQANDGFDAWGEMDDDGDNFFDASNSAKPTPAPATVAFDDGGEPDFAGWLAAQNKTKTTTKPLPKGLSKPSNGNLNVRPAPKRSVSSGIVAPGAGARKANVAAAKTSMLPAKKTTAVPKTEPNMNDDDWGAAWD